MLTLLSQCRESLTLRCKTCRYSSLIYCATWSIEMLIERSCIRTEKYTFINFAYNAFLKSWVLPAVLFMNLRVVFENKTCPFWCSRQKIAAVLKIAFQPFAISVNKPHLRKMTRLFFCNQTAAAVSRFIVLREASFWWYFICDSVHFLLLIICGYVKSRWLLSRTQ